MHVRRFKFNSYGLIIGLTRDVWNISYQGHLIKLSRCPIIQSRISNINNQYGKGAEPLIDPIITIIIGRALEA